MRILVRTVALVAGWVLYWLAVSVLSDDQGGGGANIGAGILAMALLLGGAGMWGLLDGRRWTYQQVAVVWVAVALLTGLLVPLFVWLTESADSARVLLSDVLTVGSILAVLVAGAGLVGGLVAMALRLMGADVPAQGSARQQEDQDDGRGQ